MPPRIARRRLWTLLTLLVAACASAGGPSAQSGAAAAEALPADSLPRGAAEYRVRLDPPRSLTLERSGGSTAVGEIATLHGRVRAERGDTLLLRVVELRAADGRVLGAPLGARVAIVRGAPGVTLEALPVATAARRETRTVLLLLAAAVLAALLLSFRRSFDT